MHRLRRKADVSNHGNPPSIFTASAPASLMKRIALAMASLVEEW
jgi:hypothetical protein